MKNWVAEVTAGRAGAGAPRGLAALTLAALALGTAGACATTAGGSGGGGGGAKVGQPAPELSLAALDGSRYGLSKLRGKVVLLDVWASWCEPCKQELPLLDEMAGRLKAQGIEIVAVSVDDERANIDRFLAGRPRWHISFAHDLDKQVAGTLQPEKMPSSYVLDKAGVIRFVNAGFVPEDARKIEAELTGLAQ